MFPARFLFTIYESETMNTNRNGLTNNEIETVNAIRFLVREFNETRNREYLKRAKLFACQFTNANKRRRVIRIAALRSIRGLNANI